MMKFRPFPRYHNAEIAQSIKEKMLVELTPEEVDEVRREVYAEIRLYVEAHGGTDEWVSKEVENMLIKKVLEPRLRKNGEV